MRKVSHKSSARNRSPLTSIGSVRRIKQLRSASRTQLSGENANLWCDATSLTAPLNMAVDTFPVRKGNPLISTGALRPVVSSKGFMFAGAQAMYKASGEDTFGYDAVTVIVTGKCTDNRAVGILVETYDPYFYLGKAIAMVVLPNDVKSFAIGGAVDGDISVNGVAIENVTAAIGCSYNRALSIPEACTNATNGVPGELNSSTPATYTGAFDSNYFYLGARRANSLFYIGILKSVIVIPKASTQEEVNGLSRMSFWSVK